MRQTYASSYNKRNSFGGPERKSSIDLKATISYCRNQKSLKFLKHQLKDYRTASQKTPVLKKPKQIKTDPRQTQKKDRKFYDQTPVSSKQLTNVSSKELLDKQSLQNYQALVDNLLLNLAIFKKVFQTSKKKRNLIEKLYGWDSSFKQVFFIEQELKPNLKKDEILSELGLDKKGFAGKNTYNKLRFFLAQLVNLNFKQQQVECAAQREKLNDSCSKVVHSIERLSLQSKQDSTRGYISKMKETHYDMLNMKMRIKNRGGQLERIGQKTGAINLNPFFFKQERNIHNIEAFLKESINK